MTNVNIVMTLSNSETAFKDAGFKTPKPLIRVNEKRSLIRASIFSSQLLKPSTFFFVTDHDYVLDPLSKKRMEETLDFALPDHQYMNLFDMDVLGSADLVLRLSDLIENDDPLLIFNSDQLLIWSSDIFFDKAVDDNCDVSVLTHTSNKMINGSVLVDGDKVTSISSTEKLSDESLCGVYYWKSGREFVRNARNVIETQRNSGPKNFTVADIVSQYLSENADVRFMNIKDAVGDPSDATPEYIYLGTPEAIEEKYGTEWVSFNSKA